MANQMTIRSVQCLQPSSGVVGDSVIGTIGSIVGGLVGVGAAVGISTASGGTLVLVGAAAGVAAAGAGAGIAIGLKNAITSFSDGEDDLYIDINGSKKFPKDGGDHGISAEEIVDVDLTFNFSDYPDGIKVELYDYDMISSDDLLHAVKFYKDQDESVKVVNLKESDAGSIYLLNVDFS